MERVFRPPLTKKNIPLAIPLEEIDDDEEAKT